MPDDTDLDKQIGKMIADRRRAAGLTQEKLSEQLGIGKEAFSRLERGETSLSVPRLFQLADALGCGLTELLGDISARPDDLLQQISGLLPDLSDQDRQFLLSSTRSLAEHLRER